MIYTSDLCACISDNIDSLTRLKKFNTPADIHSFSLMNTLLLYKYKSLVFYCNKIMRTKLVYIRLTPYIRGTAKLLTVHVLYTIYNKALRGPFRIPI